MAYRTTTWPIRTETWIGGWTAGFLFPETLLPAVRAFLRSAQRCPRLEAFALGDGDAVICAFLPRNAEEADGHALMASVLCGCRTVRAGDAAASDNQVVDHGRGRHAGRGHAFDSRGGAGRIANCFAAGAAIRSCTHLCWWWCGFQRKAFVIFETTLLMSLSAGGGAMSFRGARPLRLEKLEFRSLECRLRMWIRCLS